jgi:hypothetical protein
VFDANGTRLGALLSASDDAAQYRDDAGLIWSIGWLDTSVLLQPVASFEGPRIWFESTDCSGVGHAESGIRDVAVVRGGVLYRTSGVIASFNIRSEGVGEGCGPAGPVMFNLLGLTVVGPAPTPPLLPLAIH